MGSAPAAAAVDLGGLAGSVAILTSYGRIFSDLAAEDPGAPALTVDRTTTTRAELDAAANRTARQLQSLGVGVGDLVTIALPTSRALVEVALACWKVGAVPQPLSHRMSEPEQRAIVALADPKVVLGVAPGLYPDRTCLPLGWVPPADLDDSPLPEVISPVWKATATGGSTGTPKVIMAVTPAHLDRAARPFVAGLVPGTGVVVPGPLFHNGPFVYMTTALVQGCHLGLSSRFDAEATLRQVEELRAHLMLLVPTMMLRMWRLPAEVRDGYDISSLRVVWHVAAPCPPWLKEAWIGWVGAEHVFEMYAGSEAQAATIIRGDDWLAHRGSVGRAVGGEVAIFDEQGEPVPPGVEGEVYLRAMGGPGSTYRYVGAKARTLEGGWESLGDLGWLDEEGYLFLSDRRTDLILCGGANIYPAEVEAALEEHPLVGSSAVIGLPHEDLGQAVHAIVHPTGPVTAEELVAHLRPLLDTYKLPRSIELVDQPLRDDAGKVRRYALREARSAAT